MQKVKSLLPPSKAARTLAFLLDEPLSTCEKLLCGERAESASILTKLLCTEEFGEVVLLTIGEGRGVKYIEAVRRRVSLRAFKKNLTEAQQLYASALQAEIGQ